MHYTQTGAEGPFLVYRITDHVSHKYYIGLTTTTLANRWHDHRGDARSGRKPLNIAMREIGIENFTIEAIATCRTLSDLRSTEITIIRQDNTLVPNGYNRSRGGGFKPSGIRHSPETIEIIRQKAIAFAATPEGHAAKCQAFLGRRHTEESRQRMSEVQVGHDVTDQARSNMSAAQKRRYAKSPEEANCGGPAPKIDSSTASLLFGRLLTGESLAELSRSTGFSFFCINGAFRRLHGDWRKLVPDWSPRRAAMNALRTKDQDPGYREYMAEVGRRSYDASVFTPEVIARRNTAISEAKQRKREDL